jgi:hypothetical protein
MEPFKDSWSSRYRGRRAISASRPVCLMLSVQPVFDRSGLGMALVGLIQSFASCRIFKSKLST